MPTGKTVADLARVVDGKLHGEADVVVIDVTHKSDQVEEGSLFVAIVGASADGHDFVSDATERGASAVAVERPVDTAVPVIEVADTRNALGPLSAAVHDNPSHSLAVIGVTGTNGKTTVTHYIESIAARLGKTTGLIGTIKVKVGDETRATSHTTPEASEFQRLLATMRDSGVSLVTSEVSSHALHFGRVKGTRFAVAAFTNLSQDHLDFHGTMEAYGESKKRLFTDYEVETAVVNIDDPLGAEIAGSHAGELVTVGLLGDVNYSDLEPLRGGTRFLFTTPWGTGTVEAPVVGEFNVGNLAMAATCCLSLGMDYDEVLTAMARVGQVPGRFEVVSGDDPVIVVVDYAHTPQGVATAVATGRSLTKGRVIALLGAGGDRDREKRPLMGESLSAADVAVVTSDNPRSEDPQSIVQAVAAGVTDTMMIVEVERREAIRRALGMAVDGDVVLVLGRGHEPYQQLGDDRVEFDDRVVVSNLLVELRKSANLDRESGSMDT